MNERDLQNLILLKGSGECTPEQEAELEAALKEHPEAAAFSREVQVLQSAGRFSSKHTVPELTDLKREAILKRSRHRSRRLPVLLAAAAILMLGLALWSHLAPVDPYGPAPIASDVTPIRPTLTSEDPLLEDLESLDQELDQLANLDLLDEVEVDDTAYWAEQYLNLEESI